MFGINKIKLDISRLWNEIDTIGKTATCALKDGDVRHKVVHEMHQRLEKQEQAILAISNFLEVDFCTENILDPRYLPQPPVTMEVLVCKPRHATDHGKGESK